jgi:hypothetical protein
LFTKLSSLFLHLDIFFLGRKKDSFGPGEGGPRKGVKEGQKGPKKKISIFFHGTCRRAMTGPHNGTCGARAVLCGITGYRYNVSTKETLHIVLTLHIVICVHISIQSIAFIENRQVSRLYSTTSLFTSIVIKETASNHLDQQVSHIQTVTQ